VCERGKAGDCRDRSTRKTKKKRNSFGLGGGKTRQLRGSVAWRPLGRGRNYNEGSLQSPCGKKGAANKTNANGLPAAPNIRSGQALSGPPPRTGRKGRGGRARRLVKTQKKTVSGSKVREKKNLVPSRPIKNIGAGSARNARGRGFPRNGKESEKAPGDIN